MTVIDSLERLYKWEISDIKGHLSNLSTVDHSDAASESADHLLKADALLLRQRLQSLCRSVLLNNLESALNQKIETDLWNFGFKAQITALQQAMKVKSSNTKRAEIQADFSVFLENALGFYMQLLEDVCETFYLHPHFRRKFSSFGIIQGRSELCRRSHFRFPSKTSSMYICQYCLVHIGDIARYLQRISLAENYYNLASRYVPSNGQPYNQLAILCSTRSDKLAVTYYYIRSIAVRSPFPVAPTNLEKLYAKQIKDCESTNFISKNKWTHGEVVSVFLYLQALIHLEADKEKATKVADLLYRCLCSQTIFSLLTAQNMHHMVTISLFTLCHLDDTGGDKSITEDEKHFRDVTVGYLAGFLEVLLNQAQKSNVREHITLPAIKITLEWLSSREGYLSHSIIKTHRCWLNLSKVLNAIQSHSKDPNTLDLSKWDAYALPEDVELQCFLPLSDSHDSLDFNMTESLKLDSADIIRLRCKRLVELGKTLTEKYPSLNLIDYKVNSKNTKIIFSAPTAIKVEPSRRKTANRNVAIQQALKSQEVSPSASFTTSDTPMTIAEESSVWPVTATGAFSLTSTPEGSYPGGLDKVSSYSSFQSDITPLGSGVITPTDIQSYGFAAQSNISDEFLPRHNSQCSSLSAAGSSLPASASFLPASASSLPVVRLSLPETANTTSSQGVIGSELGSKPRTLAELMDSTSAADPMAQPMNFSASDSSIFASHSNSYSLFSPTFGLPTTSPADGPFPGDGLSLLGVNSLSTALSSSMGWPSASSNQQAPNLENTWGSKSALAQLFEEQQKRKQQPNKPSSLEGNDP